MLPSAVDEDELREEPGEHRVEPGTQTAHRRTERVRTGRCERDLHTRRSTPGHEQQRLAVASLQTLDRGASRVVAVDDDRLQRVAERGTHRDLATLVDLEQVDERTEHAFEGRDVVTADRRVRLFERQREHLGAGPPARRVALGATMRDVGFAQCVLGRAQLSRLRSEVGRNRDLGLHLGPSAIRLGLRGVGLAGARLERRAVGVDAAELLAHAREIDLDRAGARLQLVELLRRSLEFALGHRDRDDSERVDLRLGRLDLDARRCQRVEVEVDPASCARTFAASATSDSTTPSSATDANSRSRLRPRSVTRFTSPRPRSRNASVRASTSATSSSPGTASARSASSTSASSARSSTRTSCSRCARSRRASTRLCSRPRSCSISRPDK